MKIIRQHLKTSLALCVLLAASGFFSFSKYDDNLFEVSKNLKLFSTLMMQLNTMYVDDFDPEALLESGMNAMVKSLDPYTAYYPEKELEGFKLQTSGKYGGIGALIRTYNDNVIVVEPFEGFPAQKSGLVSGDKILKIDGKSTKGLNTEQVSGLLKGNPGTNVVKKWPRHLCLTLGPLKMEFYISSLTALRRVVIKKWLRRSEASRRKVI